MQNDKQVEYVQHKAEAKGDLNEALEHNTNPNARWEASRALRQQLQPYQWHQ